jgi:hypothetical protein
MGKTWTVVVTSLFLLVKTFICMEQVVISLQTNNWQVGTAPSQFQEVDFILERILATISALFYEL